MICDVRLDFCNPELPVPEEYYSVTVRCFRFVGEKMFDIKQIILINFHHPVRPVQLMGVLFPTLPGDYRTIDVIFYDNVDLSDACLSVVSFEGGGLSFRLILSGSKMFTVQGLVLFFDANDGLSAFAVDV